MADYENFVRGLLPRLLRYATMLTGEREQAADLVQDVLVKLYRHWSRISGTEHPDRYVLRMVTNGYLSWRRRRSIRVITTGDPPDKARADDFASDHASREDMWQRLARLPKRQRAVVVLRYYEQLADPEIADLLGCAQSTVRAHAHKALATLRNGLTIEQMAEIKENS
ncbi:SigE family RNA polymerase sigma factor [Actinocrispum wychmicini]|uniref:RNA polymerase sigma-70 factor (Sigma-E family) n=1 Tax=Actinocrispum wychmicini TaxID=1213861 RepID=A0A4R2JXU5_9PSEU|nr:SigE family RNA polymerase sigma factor [Actinocrispum wychmicini]TCO62186.1 RNA polymerase sigma-70 factor (sigma-E family) [Actinocrispum wychmicini]